MEAHAHVKLKLWEVAYRDFAAGMKYKQIAEKYEVTLSCVKSWATRYWKKLQPTEVAELKSRKKIGAPYGNQNSKGHGAPKGNKNAVGNHGGAPYGNQNALKHGLYARILTNTFTRDELSLFNAADMTPLELLDISIQALAVQEYRMLKLRDSFLQQRENLHTTGKGGDLIDDMTGTVIDDGRNKRKMQAVARRVAGKLLAIEDALTKVQDKKLRAIETKHRLLREGLTDEAATSKVEIIDDLGGA